MSTCKDFQTKIDDIDYRIKFIGKFETPKTANKEVQNTPRIQTTIDNIVGFISMNNRNSHYVKLTFRDFRGEHPQTTLDNTMGFISICYVYISTFSGSTPADHTMNIMGFIS